MNVSDNRARSCIDYKASEYAVEFCKDNFRRFIMIMLF